LTRPCLHTPGDELERPEPSEYIVESASGRLLAGLCANELFARRFEIATEQVLKHQALGLPELL